MAKHTIQQELQIIGGVVALLWIIHIADWVVPGQFTDWGLWPRTLRGLAGIITMPFLHGNLAHLFGNTIPLLILLSLMAGSRANSWQTVIGITILNGCLLWLVGRNAMHVGASGLIFGLIGFLVCAGYFERRVVSILVAGVVLFLYGTTILFGILPTAGSNVSWDGHLTGLIAGIVVAFLESRLLTSDKDPAPFNIS